MLYALRYLILTVISLVSGHARQHVLSRSQAWNYGKVAAGRASDIKILCTAWLSLLLLSCVMCVAAASLLVVTQ